MLKFIHTADLHLSSAATSVSPEVQRAVKSAQEKLLADLLSLVKNEQVGLLLFAGDIFDNPEPDTSSLKMLQDFCAELSETRIFFAPGNHDPYFNEGIWTDPAWTENVHIFTPEAERVRLEIAGIELLIDGQAFGSFVMSDELFKPEALDLSEPIAGELAQRPYRILLLHGDVVAEGQSSAYNPIRLNSLRYTDYDYLALGHVHKAQIQILKSNMQRVVYPGTPQGRGFDEPGKTGFVLGEISRHGSGPYQSKWHERSLASLLFLKLDVDVTDCEDNKAILQACLEAMRAHSAVDENDFLRHCWRISLKGSRQGEGEAALDYIKQQLYQKGAFYVRLYDLSYTSYSAEALAKQSGFAGMLYKHYQNEFSRQKKADPEVQHILEKALFYALAAHDNRLSKDAAERALDIYNDYLAEGGLS